MNGHLELRMFVVGHSITAADIFAVTKLLEHWGTLSDFEKIQLPHCFRWLDHVQHLPGIFEQVQRKGLLVGFPDENAQAPGKGQGKKDQKKKGGDPAKLAAALEAKKAATSAEPKEEKKGGAGEAQPSAASTAPQTPAGETAEKKPKPKQ